MYLGRKAMPRGNRITSQKYDDYCMRLHRRRLKTIKADVDNHSPKRHAHLRRNLKREQMMEEHYAKIERENRILLEKMSQIMQGKHGLDNICLAHKYAHSLNKNHRKRQLQRITIENQNILRRIQAREPTYNHLRWEEDRKRSEEWLHNISEYPVVICGKERGAMRENKLEYVPSIRRSASNGAYSLPRMDPEYQRLSREKALDGNHSFSQLPQRNYSGPLAPLPLGPESSIGEPI